MEAEEGGGSDRGTGSLRELEEVERKWGGRNEKEGGMCVCVYLCVCVCDCVCASPALCVSSHTLEPDPQQASPVFL